MAIELWRLRWGVTPLQPFREMKEMERRFENVINRPLWPTMWRRMPTESMFWTPTIEMFEKEDKYVVKAELLGMKKESIDVSVTGDILTIKGEKKAESEIKDEDYYCCERSYGSFSRSVALPSSVDANKIQATYEHGYWSLVRIQSLPLFSSSITLP
jgi:HSP20 family protein